MDRTSSESGASWLLGLRPTALKIQQASSQPQPSPARSRDHRPVRRSLGAGRSLITDHRSLSQRGRASAFTLLELLIVVGIIGLLMVLIAPTFTSIKSGTDVTNTAYTIKGVLDTARTYAKANNTYTWVGFAGSIGPNQQQYVTGQVKMAIVASKDGTNLWSTNNTLPSPSLIQVGKMMTLDNVHIVDTGTPTN